MAKQLQLHAIALHLFTWQLYMIKYRNQIKITIKTYINYK